ncbi:MAG: hemolysin III family protein [Bifidobacterium crudilactis]|nr:hemolysin III family protein [Bifidobacterium crudilactis]
MSARRPEPQTGSGDLAERMSSQTSTNSGIQESAHTRDAAALQRATTIRERARIRAQRIIDKADAKASSLEGTADSDTISDGTPSDPPRQTRVRLDVHGRPKPLLRGWIHAITTPLALASGIVLICLSPTASLKWACAVFMACSLILFGNSALYHLGDWSPKTTDLLRRIDHVNIFLLIAGTYTPAAFALSLAWQRVIIIGLWSCTAVAMLVHVIWISAPRWLYTVVYIIFGVSGVGFLGLFWQSPSAGPAVVWLIVAGGICYIAGAVVYALRWPNPWPKVFGFHEIFHCGTVAGYACHVVAIFLVVCNIR